MNDYRISASGTSDFETFHIEAEDHTHAADLAAQRLRAGERVRGLRVTGDIGRSGMFCVGFHVGYQTYGADKYESTDEQFHVG